MEDNYIKEQKIKDVTDSQKEEELIKNVMKTKFDLEVARNNFEFAEGELVDYYSYQIKANQAKLDYLFSKLKKRGTILDLSKRIALKNKKVI